MRKVRRSIGKHVFLQGEEEMKTVIGLFEERANAQAVASFAHNSGIGDTKVKMLDSASTPADLVEPGPRQMTVKGIRGFTILGVIIFALFGLGAAITTVRWLAPATGANPAEAQAAAVATAVVFILIGLFSGLFMGWVKGRSDADNAIQDFRDAIDRGAVALVVQSDKHAKLIAEEMKKQHAHEVYVTKQVNPMPVFHPQAFAAAH
jgi:hypothetical protein